MTLNWLNPSPDGFSCSAPGGSGRFNQLTELSWGAPSPHHSFRMPPDPVWGHDGNSPGHSQLPPGTQPPYFAGYLQVTPISCSPNANRGDRAPTATPPQAARQEGKQPSTPSTLQAPLFVPTYPSSRRRVPVPRAARAWQSPSPAAQPLGRADPKTPPAPQHLGLSRGSLQSFTPPRDEPPSWGTS